jgi:putative ABC transport system permease protein
VQGTGIEYLTIREWSLAASEWFTSQEIEAASKVAVLGETVRAQLFGSVDPVGQIMQVGNVPFRVMGVLEAKGQSAWGQDQDGHYYPRPPTPQCRRRSGRRPASTASWPRLAAMLNCHRLSNKVTALLRQRHRLQPWQENDFSIQPLADMAAAEEESTRVMTLLLGSIAFDLAAGWRHWLL